MAENNELEGFDDLDNLFDEGGGEGESEAGGEFSQDLDSFLDEDSGAGEGGAELGGADEGGDSELDSFFEDLSTIDDLEVVQEEGGEEPEAALAAAAPVAAAAAVGAAAAAASQPAAPRKAKEPRKGGFFKKLFMLLLLGGLAAGGYYAYTFFMPAGELPWEVAETAPAPEPPKPMLRPTPAPPPPPPAPVAMQPAMPAPPPPPVAAPARPAPRHTGPWYGIQVATCFFPSCVDSFRAALTRGNLGTRTKNKAAHNEVLELFSRTTYRNREAAEGMAEQINQKHRLEGRAFALRSDGVFRISMGTFTDLTRVNAVKDSLNQLLAGQVNFTTRVKTVPYQLKTVIGGRFPSAATARKALAALKRKDSRFAGAFVVRM